MLPMVEDTGADGIELNFGCPHGMSERGMGAAVGQVPEYVEMVARWCKQHSRMPVIVKLTPNITDVRFPARGAMNGGADAVSLINTINSIVGVDLDRMAPEPNTDGKGTHGGYCGEAVKPIALSMVAEIARDPETNGLPISGIGGITDWRDAVEFMALGAGNVQVCTAAMVYGFRIVEDMIAGLEAWMDDKGYARLDDFVGRAVPNVTDWQYLNLNYVVKARIDQVLVRQANWQKVGGASPPERRSNRTTFLREPCVGSREGAGEASVAAWMGRAIEHRKSDGPGCRGFQIGRRQYRRRRFGEMSASPAVSENPCTFARLLLGPWEVFKLPRLS